MTDAPANLHARVRAERKSPAPFRGGWLLVIVLPVAAFLGARMAHWPRWGLMWALAVAIFVGLKWLTLRQARLANNVPAWRQVGYLFAWPGMDANVFFDSRLHPAVPRPAVTVC